jgi:hypothetical protein
MDRQLQRYEANTEGTGRRRRMTIEDEDLDCVSDSPLPLWRLNARMGDSVLGWTAMVWLVAVASRKLFLRLKFQSRFGVFCYFLR